MTSMKPVVVVMIGAQWRMVLAMSERRSISEWQGLFRSILTKSAGITWNPSLQRMIRTTPQDNANYFRSKRYLRTDKYPLSTMVYGEIRLPPLMSAFGN